MAKALVQFSLKNGSKDNISVIVLKFKWMIDKYISLTYIKYIQMTIKCMWLINYILMYATLIMLFLWYSFKYFWVCIKLYINSNLLVWFKLYKFLCLYNKLCIIIIYDFTQTQKSTDLIYKAKGFIWDNKQIVNEAGCPNGSCHHQKSIWSQRKITIVC